MKRTILLSSILIVSSLLLTSCGGGSSDSGTDGGGGEIDDPLTENTSGTDTSGTDTGSTTPGNTNPVIDEFEAAPDTVMIDEVVSLTWTLQDADSDSLTCTADVNGDGTNDYTVTECNSNSVIEHIYSVPGDYTVELEVTDGQGGSAIADMDVSVLPLSYKVIAEPVVEPGQWTRYQLTISNVSLVPVKNVRVLYRVPAGQEFRYDSNIEPDPVRDNCIICDDGDEVYWDFPSFEVGQSRTIDINVRIADTVPAGTALTVPITVTADGLLDSIKRDKTVLVANNLTSMLEMSSTSDAVQAGELVSLLVDIGNINNANLSNLQLRTQLPLNASAVAISNSGSYDESSRSVIWNLDSLPVLQSAQRSVTFRVPDEAVPGQILTSRSELSLDGGANASSISEYAMTVSDLPPALNLDINVVSNPVKAGSWMRYEVTVSNTSLIPVKNVLLSYRVPKGLSFRYDANAEPDAVRDDCIVCEEQHEVYWRYESMAAGQSHTIDINAFVLDTVQAGNLLSAPFTLTADDMLDDISVMNAFSVSNDSAVEVALSSSNDALQPGAELTFNVDIGNVSSVAVNNLEVSTRLPPGVVLQNISDGGTLDTDANIVSWSVENLPVSGTIRRAVTVNVPTDAIAGQILTASTEVRHDGGLELDKVAEHSITITGSQPPLSLAVRIVSGAVKAGERLRYEIELKNESLVPIKNVQILFRTPAGLTFRYDDDAEPDAVRDDCIICEALDEVYWAFPSMEIGETQVIELNANVLTTLPVGSLIVSPFRATSDGQIDDLRIVNVVPVE